MSTLLATRPTEHVLTLSALRKAAKNALLTNTHRSESPEFKDHGSTVETPRPRAEWTTWTTWTTWVTWVTWNAGPG